VVGREDIENHAPGQFTKFLSCDVQADCGAEEIEVIQRIRFLMEHAAGRVEMRSPPGLACCGHVKSCHEQMPARRPRRFFDEPAFRHANSGGLSHAGIGVFTPGVLASFRRVEFQQTGLSGSVWISDTKCAIVIRQNENLVRSGVSPTYCI
jgi:hypothetical protein